MNKKIISNHNDYAILRSLFISEINEEIKKIKKHKKINTKTIKYQKMLEGLNNQLKSFEIKNEDLKVNKLAFEKIKRDQQLARIKWYFIGGFIVFIIVIIIVIILMVYEKN